MRPLQSTNFISAEPEWWGLAFPANICSKFFAGEVPLRLAAEETTSHDCLALRIFGHPRAVTLNTQQEGLRFRNLPDSSPGFPPPSQPHPRSRHHRCPLPLLRKSDPKRNRNRMNRMHRLPLRTGLPGQPGSPVSRQHASTGGAGGSQSASQFSGFSPSPHTPSPQQPPQNSIANSSQSSSHAASQQKKSSPQTCLHSRGSRGNRVHSTRGSSWAQEAPDLHSPQDKSRIFVPEDEIPFHQQPGSHKSMAGSCKHGIPGLIATPLIL